MSVKNRTAKERCGYCANTGQVIYDLGAPDDPAWRASVRGMPIRERQVKGLSRTVYAEARAPCPYCELGKLLEFPPEGTGPWGKDGFWRGKSTSDLRPVDTGEKPLPAAENARRMNELIHGPAPILDLKPL